MKTNVYQMVTDRIVEQMNKGIIPWHRPWTGVGVEDAGAINYVSRRPYSLINQMILGRPGEWLTWKQIADLGGKVKKGAKAEYVVFYTQYVIDDKNDSENQEEAAKNRIKKTIPILRFYKVFHLDDVDGIATKIVPGESPKTSPIEAAETVFDGYLSREPALKFINDKPSNRAYYSPATDTVVVPMLSQFPNPVEYYSTAFHELTHSTIPENRCNRKTENQNAFFGNTEYSREELVAELGSAMLCHRTGIEVDKVFRNSVAYLQGWLKALRNDDKMIVWAATRAEKAARYILNETAPAI